MKKVESFQRVKTFDVERGVKILKLAFQCFNYQDLIFLTTMTYYQYWALIVRITLLNN